MKVAPRTIFVPHRSGIEKIEAKKSVIRRSRRKEGKKNRFRVKEGTNMSTAGAR
jgi:hypothetical protein